MRGRRASCCGATCCAAVLLRRNRRRGNPVGPRPDHVRPLRRRREGAAAVGRCQRLARLREPDGARDAERGGDRARPRLRRRNRRPPLGAARRPDGQGLRPRHDRRDAGAGPENAQEAGATNVEFLKGEIEAIPLPDGSVDVIISNCVINLSADKDRSLREASGSSSPAGASRSRTSSSGARCRPAIRKSVELWIGCLAGRARGEGVRGEARSAGLRGRRDRPDAGLPRRRRPRVSRGGRSRRLAIAAEADGKFMSAFVKARKPAKG